MAYAKTDERHALSSFRFLILAISFLRTKAKTLSLSSQAISPARHRKDSANRDKCKIKSHLYFHLRDAAYLIQGYEFYPDMTLFLWGFLYRFMLFFANLRIIFYFCRIKPTLLKSYSEILAKQTITVTRKDDKLEILLCNLTGMTFHRVQKINITLV